MGFRLWAFGFRRFCGCRRWSAGACNVPQPPLDHRAQHGPQILSLRSQLVLHPRWMQAVAMWFDDSVRDQAAEPLGQNVGGNLLGRFQELDVPSLSSEQV